MNEWFYCAGLLWATKNNNVDMVVELLKSSEININVCCIISYLFYHFFLFFQIGNMKPLDYAQQYGLEEISLLLTSYTQKQSDYFVMAVLIVNSLFSSFLLSSFLLYLFIYQYNNVNVSETCQLHGQVCCMCLLTNAMILIIIFAARC